MTGRVLDVHELAAEAQSVHDGAEVDEPERCAAEVVSLIAGGALVEVSDETVEAALDAFEDAYAEGAELYPEAERMGYAWRAFVELVLDDHVPGWRGGAGR